MFLIPSTHSYTLDIYYIYYHKSFSYCSCGVYDTTKMNTNIKKILFHITTVDMRIIIICMVYPVPYQDSSSAPLTFAQDLVRHNLVVFRSGEGALQVLPNLVDVIPEARLNLVIYYLKQVSGLIFN